MKVVDTFLFCEEYERELLLAKLTMQSPRVDLHVLVESDVTFRGDYKGLQAKKMVEEDDRFAPYCASLLIVEHKGRLRNGPPEYRTYQANEVQSRQLAWATINDFASDGDWLIVSDVDEMFDFQSRDRLDAFERCLKENRGRSPNFEHYRYWFDYDNRCYHTGFRTPVIEIGLIRSKIAEMDIRTRPPSVSFIVAADGNPVCFEYSYCFSYESNWKKLNSFTHDGYTRGELDISLLTNHWTKAAARKEKVGGKTNRLVRED